MSTVASDVWIMKHEAFQQNVVINVSDKVIIRQRHMFLLVCVSSSAPLHTGLM